VIVRVNFSGESAHPDAIRAGSHADVDVRVELSASLPFRSSCIDVLLLGRSLGYVDDLLATMEEIWRVARHGASVHARLPHASSSWGASRDPRLRRLFTLETFRYFEPGQRNGSARAAFEIERARLHLKGRATSGGALSQAVDGLANQSRGMQHRWERWLAPMIGGFEEVSVVLSAVKTPPIA
jgi:Methyltransferase domain